MSAEPHVCPWWIGYLLASPVRRLLQNPDRILSPHVRQGMAALDFGCAMGFFSLPLARLVGPDGRVVCVDCQQRMLDGLQRRARRANVEAVIEPRLAENGDFGLASDRDRFDFAIALAVMHEVPDQAAAFSALHVALRPGVRLLFAEPTGHVDRRSFDAEIDLARRVGFTVAEHLQFRRCHAAALQKPT